MKMDRKLVAAKERHEIAYIAKKFKIRQVVVRGVVRSIGRSRAKVYARLREMGYPIRTRNHPK